MILIETKTRMDGRSFFSIVVIFLFLFADVLEYGTDFSHSVSMSLPPLLLLVTKL